MHKCISQLTIILTSLTLIHYHMDHFNLFKGRIFKIENDHLNYVTSEYRFPLKTGEMYGV